MAIHLSCCLPMHLHNPETYACVWGMRRKGIVDSPSSRESLEQQRPRPRFKSTAQLPCCNNFGHAYVEVVCIFWYLAASLCVALFSCSGSDEPRLAASNHSPVQQRGNRPKTNKREVSRPQMITLCLWSEREEVRIEELVTYVHEAVQTT